MFSHSIPLGIDGSAQNRLPTSHSGSTPSTSLLNAARRAAMIELAQAPCCCCCENLIQHVCKCLGSTLFFDDDPSCLWRGLTAEDRSLFTPRVLASCIAISGRAREELYPTQRQRAWPALSLLTSQPLPSHQDSTRAGQGFLDSIRQSDRGLAGPGEHICRASRSNQM